MKVRYFIIPMLIILATSVNALCWNPLELFCLFAEEEVLEEITYTRSTETRCKDGVCNLVLYSGIRFVEEDNQWKKVENAKSLKNKGFEIVYLEDDTFHKVDVVDFNMTFIEFALNFDENSLRFEEFEHEIEEGKLKTKFKIVEVVCVENVKDCFEEEIEFEIEIEEEEKFFIYNGDPFGKKFKFGDNSTTIQIQDADTENFDDDDIHNVGSYAFVYIDDADAGSYGDSFGKFDISAVPSGQSIDEAIFVFFATATNGIDNDDIVGCWGVENYQWNEEDGASTTLRTEDGTNIVNKTGVDIDAGVNNWVVTNWVSTEYGSGKGNVTFGFFIWEDADSDDNWFTWKSKEDEVTADRPYLNITYSAVGDTTAPTVSLIAISNNSYWDVDNAPDFNYSCTDAVGVVNASLFINGTYNKSNDGTSNFTDNPIGNGDYGWFVNCSDAVPNWGYSGFYNLKVNVSAPPVDTCDCPDPASRWGIDLADDCTIDSDCDIRPYETYCYGTAGGLSIYANLYTRNFTCNFDNVLMNKSGNIWIEKN